ncbi:glucuronate isomerase [Fusobacterium sp. PH5-44]|uniref:glucuronate isomerase n=1 Tax=unclassified Fusobacterium TaxID=2648384 RepID=UPI003D1BE5F7
MRKFMTRDFLLHTETAKFLYHNYAAKMPIIDYHCHLQPQDIFEDKKFDNLTEVWLGAGDGFGDHYKWRALRACGYDENLISGDANARERFDIFVKTIPYAIGNPLYHWSHLELNRYFGIKEVIKPENADIIWEKANRRLKNLSAREIMYKFNVETVCTTDDPTDDLGWHQKMSADKSLKTKVLPAFRPDKAINVELDGFKDWVTKLSGVVRHKIKSIDDLCKALDTRIEFFHSMGCRLSDHALDTVHYKDATKLEVNQIFLKGLSNNEITTEEKDKYKGYILVHLGKMYAKYKWVQQYHIGALRNNSKRMLTKIGPDTGFDAIKDDLVAEKLSALLDKLDSTGDLPKTILYNLNPRDNEVLAVLAGCFQDAGSKIKSKIQFGSAWWFLDQKDGMEKQLETLSQVGMLSHFIGMLTDSRSFLSYTRHEYFRRILCNKIGKLVENGEYPEDLPLLSKIVEDICYYNAKEYLGI